MKNGGWVFWFTMLIAALSLLEGCGSPDPCHKYCTTHYIAQHGITDCEECVDYLVWKNEWAERSGLFRND